MKNNLFKAYHSNCKTLFIMIRDSKAKNENVSYGYVVGFLSGLYHMVLNYGDYELSNYIIDHNNKLIDRFNKIY